MYVVGEEGQARDLSLILSSLRLGLDNDVIFNAVYEMTLMIE